MTRNIGICGSESVELLGSGLENYLKPLSIIDLPGP